MLATTYSVPCTTQRPAALQAFAHRLAKTAAAPRLTAGPAPVARPAVSTRAVGGSGIADAPTTAPPVHEKSVEGIRRNQPIYKVLLHNDNYNRREYVVNVLVTYIAGLSRNEATECMREAHDTGVSMVLACPMEEAEEYCEKLRLNGLCSTIEPGC